jgi:hypothetical protein
MVVFLPPAFDQYLGFQEGIIANIGDGIELAEKYDLPQAEIKLNSGNL